MAVMPGRLVSPKTTVNRPLFTLTPTAATGSPPLVPSLFHKVPLT